MPKSVPRLVVDKVKLLYSSEMFLIQSILLDIKVPNKSLSQELNNVLFIEIGDRKTSLSQSGHRENPR